MATGIRSRHFLTVAHDDEALRRIGEAFVRIPIRVEEATIETIRSIVVAPTRNAPREIGIRISSCAGLCMPEAGALSWRDLCVTALEDCGELHPLWPLAALAWCVSHGKKMRHSQCIIATEEILHNGEPSLLLLRRMQWQGEEGTYFTLELIPSTEEVLKSHYETPIVWWD